jgi:hypothetical protein
MGDRYHWIALYDALYWMQFEAFKFSIFNHEEALRNALLSGEVPVRGKSRFGSEYQRIEKDITTAEVLITVNMVRPSLMSSQSASFDSVQVDRILLEKWLTANALETDAGRLFAAHEHSAISFLTGQLGADRDMTRGEAWAVCRAEFRALSERGFRSRIWPSARQAAGLEPRAHAGRKRRKG